MRSEKIRELEPPAPVYEENPELAYGEEKIVEQAQPGSVWKSYRIRTKKWTGGGRDLPLHQHL